VRIEEIAPSEDNAAGQAAALATLVTLARGFTTPLGDNTANEGLKELLKSAEVSQKKDRVVVTGALPMSFLTSIGKDEKPAQGENSPTPKAP
jgi:hypothetical protein